MMGPVYVITDPESHVPVPEQVRAAALGGARLIQIRDKTASDRDLIALILQMLPHTRERGIKLIVNDRADVALAAGADGLHIGQGDGDVRLLRQRLPDSMILGLSVETEEQARAVLFGVDYIGAGPVRATATKPDHAPPIGLDGLARITAAVSVPVYAIGGVKLGDARSLHAAGACGVAVVTAVTRAADPVAATRALVQEWAQL